MKRIAQVTVIVVQQVKVAYRPGRRIHEAQGSAVPLLVAGVDSERLVDSPVVVDSRSTCRFDIRLIVRSAREVEIARKPVVIVHGC